jgi:GT2 family glycosyltransferase
LRETLLISVVIPTHNRKDGLQRCLQAVAKQDYPDFEVIVVDDGSSDGTEDLMRRAFPDLRFLRQETNRGPAAARNRGIQAATGDIVAFTDDDCVVPGDWLSTLAAGFQKFPGVVGVGGYQQAPEEWIRSRVVAAADRCMRLRGLSGRRDTEQLGGNEIPGLGTNNVAYRREVLLEVGGFDEGFRCASGEDADLKLRIARSGYRLLYVPLGVLHCREYTLQAQWRLYRRRGIGAYCFEAKHFKPPGPGRILLRLLKRTALFARDLFSLPWRVAAVIYLSLVADCLGQFRAMREANANGSRPRPAHGVHE